MRLRCSQELTASRTKLMNIGNQNNIVQQQLLQQDKLLSVTPHEHEYVISIQELGTQQTHGAFIPSCNHVHRVAAQTDCWQGATFNVPQV